MALSKIRPRVSSNGVLYPLDFVYARSGVEMPEAEVIEAGSIPQPYRSLLVHKTDMTLTLERHFGGRVALRYVGRPWRASPWMSPSAKVPERMPPPERLSAEWPASWKRR